MEGVEAKGLCTEKDQGSDVLPQDSGTIGKPCAHGPIEQLLESEPDNQPQESGPDMQLLENAPTGLRRSTRQTFKVDRYGYDHSN